jgi:hypothetical protein
MPLNIEKAPWTVEITRNSAGLVSRVRVIAAEPRSVTCTTFEGSRDRVGRQVLGKILSSKTDSHPAVVADCGIPYAGLASETLLAHGDLIAAAPELYAALEKWLQFSETKIGIEDSVLIREVPRIYAELQSAARAVLAKARGEAA